MLSQASFQQLSWSSHLQESHPNNSFSLFSLNQCWSCIPHRHNLGHPLSTSQHRLLPRELYVSPAGWILDICVVQQRMIQIHGLWSTEFQQNCQGVYSDYFFAPGCSTINDCDSYVFYRNSTYIFHTNVELHKPLRTGGLLHPHNPPQHFLKQLKFLLVIGCTEAEIDN